MAMAGPTKTKGCTLRPIAAAAARPADSPEEKSTDRRPPNHREAGDSQPRCLAVPQEKETLAKDQRRRSRPRQTPRTERMCTAEDGAIGM